MISLSSHEKCCTLWLVYEPFNTCKLLVYCKQRANAASEVQVANLSSDINTFWYIWCVQSGLWATPSPRIWEHVQHAKLPLASSSPRKKRQQQFGSPSTRWHLQVIGGLPNSGFFKLILSVSQDWEPEHGVSLITRARYLGNTPLHAIPTYSSLGYDANP